MYYICYDVKYYEKWKERIALIAALMQAKNIDYKLVAVMEKDFKGVYAPVDDSHKPYLVFCNPPPPCVIKHDYQYYYYDIFAFEHKLKTGNL